MQVLTGIKSRMVFPFQWVLGVALFLGFATHGYSQSVLPEQYSLKEVLTRIEANNRAVQNAKLLSEVAAADVRRADVGMNPTLSAGAFNSNAGRYRPKELDQTIRIEQTFERGNKRSLRVASAKELQLAALADIQESIRQQKILGAISYIDLSVAQRLKKLIDENESNFKRLVEGAQRRLKAGDIAPADVSRLSVESSRANNEVRAADNNLIQAQVKLAALLAQEGKSIAAADALPDAGTIKSLQDFVSRENHAIRVSSAVSARSDVAAAKARIAAQEQAFQLAKSLQTRDITLGAQTEKAPGFGGRVFGLSASIPLLTGNDYSADILRAGVDLSLAQADLERLVAQIRSELQGNYEQLLSSRDRLNSLLNITLPEVVKTSQAIEYAYVRGAATLTDLFDARRQFTAVQTEAALAEGELARALYTYQSSANLAVE
jgi:outer membrane protein, heavy metal efflux system